MTSKMFELRQQWKQQKMAQINNLFREGVPIKEIKDRFGSELVTKALGSKVYNKIKGE